MSITTLDGIVAGAQYPRVFMKAVTGTLVAGRPTIVHNLEGIPAVSVIGSASGNIPKAWSITSISNTNPTVITVTSHPWANGDTISIQGTDSDPFLDGTDYTISNVSGSTFTIPVDVTSAGTTGTASGQTSNGGAGLNGYALTSFSGQIPFTNPVSGNTYLARFLAQADGQHGQLLLCDRLWHNGGYDPSKITAQTAATPVQIPSRDDNGTNNGVGVYAALEVYSNLGAGAPAFPTLTYTSSDGVVGQTTTPLQTIPASSIAGTFYPFGLAAGDVGIQKIQSITFNPAPASGQLGIVLYRVIASLDLSCVYYSGSIDAITGGFSRIYDNSCLFLVYVPNTTTATKLNGTVIWTQG